MSQIINGHYEPVMEWVEDWEDEMLDDYDEEQERLRDEMEAEDCHCGAKRIGSNGRLTYVADCCC